MLRCRRTATPARGCQGALRNNPALPPPLATLRLSPSFAPGPASQIRHPSAYTTFMRPYSLRMDQLRPAIWSNPSPLKFQTRHYSKQSKAAEPAAESFQEVRKRAQIRKHGAAMKERIEQDAMDPLLRKAYQEIEDEDRIAKGLPPLHSGVVDKSSKSGTGVRTSKQSKGPRGPGARKGKKK